MSERNETNAADRRRAVVAAIVVSGIMTASALPFFVTWHMAP